MCGIVGIVGDIGNNEEKIFSFMLKIDTVRGKDSTGVVIVGGNKVVSHSKVVGTAWDFFEKSKLFYKHGMCRSFARTLIGHNRSATAGNVNTSNAHPFDYKNIIGVHNGTLEHGSYELEDWDKHTCDSKALYQTIDKNGLEDAISKSAGAWSLVYYDKKEESVVFIRNSKRPMFFAFSSNNKTMFFASEKWMIEVACNKYNVKISDICSTKENIKYCLHPFKESKDGSLLWTYQEKEIKGKVYTQPSYTTYTYKNNKYSGMYSRHGKNSFFNTNSKKNEYIVKNIIKSKQPIHVYYPILDCLINNNNKFITCFTKDGVNVRVMIGKNDIRRKQIINSKEDQYFTFVPNSFVSYPKEYAILCQANSMCGPFDVVKDKHKTQNDIENKYTEIVVQGFSGDMLNKKEFNARVSKGCCYCSNNSTVFEDFYKMRWLSNFDYLCENCKDDPNVSNFLIEGSYYSV